MFSISFSSFAVVSFFGYKLGSNGSLLFICTNSIFLLIFSLLLFKENFNSYLLIDYNIGTWFNVDLVNVAFGIKIDSLTSTMLVVITTISLFAQVYSVDYMYFDPHKPRFFSYLALFTFFMLILVCSNNLFLMFVGWEGVGICSYLLINFWYFRVQANKSSILAVTINKIGDLSFLIAISLIQSFSKSTELIIFNNISNYIHLSDSRIPLNNFVFTYLLELDNLLDIVSFSTLFFIIACVGKSAQLGLHLWLPEAMEGPTPVSSLIHAATMVTAGIYLILRVSFLLKFAPTSLVVILVIGSLTTLFAASIGLVQVDVKKIVAYSTCSQLGYMFMGCGYKGFNFVIFHLFIHAFFKALLFLTAGYIIHLLVNEQDTRKMGGLLKISHFSYIANSIGSLALIGFPFFSGFYSKEKILEELSLTNLLFIDKNNYESLISIAGIFSYTTLIITILYSFKVLSEIFFGRYNGFKKTLSGLSYSESFIIVPLFLLSILSIYSGYIFNDAMIGVGTDFWSNSFLVEDRFFFFNVYALEEFSLVGENLHTIYNIAENNHLLDKQISIFSSQNFTYSNSISESQWLYSQWIVPVWTFYYLFCIFFLRFFFLKETRYYLFSLLLGSSIWLSFFNSLTHKYIYINRLIIVPSILYAYYNSYNLFYRVIEKGLLEQVGGYGIYNTIQSVLDFKITKHTFLLYHYLGLVVVSLFVLLFLLGSFL
jgi:proton-translocating NADH-quinone oxidoreductase chain L